MVFNEWQTIQSYIDSIADELRINAPELSGDLKNSFDVTVSPSSSGAKIEIDMTYYGRFIDEGVNGVKVSWGSPYSFRDKRPPASAFSKYTSNLSEQFAIAASVYSNGIRPRNFIQPVLDNKLQGLADLITDSIFNNFFNGLEGKQTKIKIW